jgi:hypothetical protein
MKRIKLKELPKVLDEATINILAHMANEIPQSNEWHEIIETLSDDDYRIIMDKRIEIQKMEAELIKSQMTNEEKKEREESRQKMLKKLEEDPYYFYGNMSRPDTPEEYKSRFGVWPDGSDGDTYEPNK